MVKLSRIWLKSPCLRLVLLTLVHSLCLIFRVPTLSISHVHTLGLFLSVSLSK